MLTRLPLSKRKYACLVHIIVRRVSVWIFASELELHVPIYRCLYVYAYTCMTNANNMPKGELLKQNVYFLCTRLMSIAVMHILLVWRL